MQVIIKPTGLCNFRCKFCSAANLSINHPSDGKCHQQIKDLIADLKPRSIIITGGEPLMVPPEYYYDLHEFYPCNISPTTNLKDFYLHPDKWTPLFNEKWFTPTTSFNYGDTRMWDEDTVYSEEMFIKVIELFKERTGAPPPSFIAVIDDYNEHTVMDHVLLAKKLGMKAKLNNAIAMGIQDVTYQRYKMFAQYLKVIDAGLGDYEWHCSNKDLGICPHNINLLCESCIRCCFVDNTGNLHVSSCEDEISVGIEFPTSRYNLGAVKEIIDPEDFITPECSYCELFRLCNGCRSNRRNAKTDPNYCEEMSKLKDRIIETGWYI